MSESPEQPKTQEELFREAIIKTAQDPINMLIRFKDKGLLPCIWSLVAARDTIIKDSTYRIEGVHSQYKAFHIAKSDTLEFYEALVSMLKAASYTKIEIDSALFDMISHRSQSSAEVRAVARKISTICQVATAKVFESN